MYFRSGITVLFSAGIHSVQNYKPSLRRLRAHCNTSFHHSTRKPWCAFASESLSRCSHRQAFCAIDIGNSAETTFRVQLFAPSCLCAHISKIATIRCYVRALAIASLRLQCPDGPSFPMLMMCSLCGEKKKS